MFQYESTTIRNLEFHLPDANSEITGTCNVSAAVGIPGDYETNKTVLCKVEVDASINGSDVDLLKCTAISEFLVVGDDCSPEEVRKNALKECPPIALKAVSEVIAKATKELCGQSIYLPLV